MHRVTVAAIDHHFKALGRFLQAWMAVEPLSSAETLASSVKTYSTKAQEKPLFSNEAFYRKDDLTVEPDDYHARCDRQTELQEGQRRPTLDATPLSYLVRYHIA